jgi:hypothetical protein
MPEYGAQELLDIELYLAWRGNGLPVDLGALFERLERQVPYVIQLAAITAMLSMNVSSPRTPPTTPSLRDTPPRAGGEKPISL